MTSHSLKAKVALLTMVLVTGPGFALASGPLTVPPLPTGKLVASGPLTVPPLPTGKLVASGPLTVPPLPTGKFAV